MANCKDCLSYEVCNKQKILNHKISQSVCKHFKDHLKFVDLPCKVGDTVYVVDCNDNLCPILETTVNGFYIDDKGICYFKASNFYDKIPVSQFGKTVFLTPEEAEKVLEERKK